MLACTWWILSIAHDAVMSRPAGTALRAFHDRVLFCSVNFVQSVASPEFCSRGARARGARVPKFVVTKSFRSESHLALGLQKRIWLKFFATVWHSHHSNWWLWRSNFELTELGRKISTAIVWTAAKFAYIRKLQGARAPVPHDCRRHCVQRRNHRVLMRKPFRSSRI